MKYIKTSLSSLSYQQYFVCMRYFIFHTFPPNLFSGGYTNSLREHLNKEGTKVKRVLKRLLPSIKDKIAKMTSEDYTSEIGLNQMNKVIFASRAQELNIARAEYCLEVAKDWYKQILGKDWTKPVKGNLKSVGTDGKSQKWIKDNLKQGILI